MNRWAVSTLITLAVATGLWAGFRRPAPTVVHAGAETPALTEIERGRAVYVRFGCAMCHGPDGAGGMTNPNSETEGKIPAVIYVAEGYTKPELRRYLGHGAPLVGKFDPEGPQPPYTMPGWDDRMTEESAIALTEYLFSLYPEDAADVW